MGGDVANAVAVEEDLEEEDLILVGNVFQERVDGKVGAEVTP
jgi:hypothetical protein